MPAHIINVALTETFRLRAGTTGETFTITNATTPTGTSWAGPTISEVGSGAYRLTFTPTVVGVYLATITGNTSGEVFSGSWEVIATPSSIFTTRANGQVPTASWWNDLQTAVSQLKGRLG